MIKAIEYHDLGKSQPELSVGDVVNPKDVFKNGKLHAERGAYIAKNTLGVNDDVYNIIFYHHHAENELPPTFPKHLLPMHRLFRTIDGLSAALTRGEVNLEFDVYDCKIRITEDNVRPEYNGTRIINLYTGKHDTFH